MPDRTTFPSDVYITGALSVSGDLPPYPRASLVQDTLALYPIPWGSWRVWDAYQTVLPGTPATDDLALIGGTFGTGTPSIQTEDLKTAGATNKYARTMLVLPPEYDGGETLSVRFHAGMLTTVADGSATIDAEVYLSDNEAGLGLDLVTTAAQSINSLTLADKDFTIDPAGLVAGDILDLRITLAINDAASGTAVKGIVGAAFLMADIKG